LYPFSTFNRATGPVRELDAALIDAGIWNVAGESSLTELRIEF
jgi:hypothetical protein